MTTCFIQNDEVFTERNSLFSQYSFLIRKLVIWWLFNDDLRVRGQELEKKGTTNSAPLSLVPLVFRLCYTIYIQMLWEHWHLHTVKYVPTNTYTVNTLFGGNRSGTVSYLSNFGFFFMFCFNSAQNPPSRQKSQLWKLAFLLKDHGEKWCRFLFCF